MYQGCIAVKKVLKEVERSFVEKFGTFQKKNPTVESFLNSIAGV